MVFRFLETHSFKQYIPCGSYKCERIHLKKKGTLDQLRFPIVLLWNLLSIRAVCGYPRIMWSRWWGANQRIFSDATPQLIMSRSIDSGWKGESWIYQQIIYSLWQRVIGGRLIGQSN
jgi:hypothetical protein